RGRPGPEPTPLPEGSRDAGEVPEARGNGPQAPTRRLTERAKSGVGRRRRGRPAAIAGSFHSMGTVYAIANQKGGVGKTTTAVNVSACIAEAGYATLLVDVDPQANATVGLGIDRAQAPGLYEVLTGEAGAVDALVDSPIAGLQVLPAGAGLAGAKVEVPRIAGFEERRRAGREPRGDRV